MWACTPVPAECDGVYDDEQTTHWSNDQLQTSWAFTPVLAPHTTMGGPCMPQAAGTGAYMLVHQDSGFRVQGLGFRV